MNSYIECGDCLELMKKIPEKSIDMVFCDLPYGTTNNSWDIVLPLDDLWTELKRVSKNNACIALWAQSPFDKILACSNLKMYRYEWIIEKTKGTGFLNVNKMPLKCHETILIFYKNLPVYNPQKKAGFSPTHASTKFGLGANYGKGKKSIYSGGSTERWPRDVLKYKWDTQKAALHPTQKPLDVCEYMIKTYTNEHAVVLDCCMGSGTTCVAAFNTNRKYIGIEKEQKYYKISKMRLQKCQKQLRFFE